MQITTEFLDACVPVTPGRGETEDAVNGKRCRANPWSVSRISIPSPVPTSTAVVENAGIAEVHISDLPEQALYGGWSQRFVEPLRLILQAW